MSLGNLSPTERWMSTLSGFGMLLGAAAGRGWMRRIALAAGGATLVSRGVTGYCGMKAALTGEAASLGRGMREQWQRTRSQVGAGAAGIDTLEMLHLEEMQELASSTAQLARLLDGVERGVEHPELRKSIRSYSTQLHSRRQDLERLISSRGASARRHPDQAMQALIEEAWKMSRIPSPAVRDAALVDSVQRLVHYQIAAEGSAAAHAKALGRDEDAATIADWADRDKAIDASLTELATGLLNAEAAGRGARTAPADRSAEAGSVESAAADLRPH